MRRNGDIGKLRCEQRSTHAQCISRSSRGCRQQETPKVPREPPGGSPFSGGGSSDWGSNQSSLHSTRIRVSKESKQSLRAARGLRVKVNLPIFKDEKTKDAVTYHLWRSDVAIFCSSGWDDQHLLPYILLSLQGFLHNLAMSLSKDATLTDVLQMLDVHYSVVMMFDTLSKECYFLKQGWERM